MAGLRARMAAELLCLAAGLLARPDGILAVSRPVAGFLARVGATLQRFFADQSTSHVRQPARLVLEPLLPAETFLLRQEGAFGTTLIVRVAVVRGLRVAAGLGPFALKPTRRRFCATWKRGMQHRSSAVTGDLLEDRLPTRGTWALVAEFRARMPTAFEHSAADSGADMLGLDIVVRWATRRRIE